MRFHVKRPHWSHLLAAAALAFALSLAACTGVTNPDGWAAPVFGPDNVAYLQLKPGVLTALSLTDHKELWAFPDPGNAQQKKLHLGGFYATPALDAQHNRLYLAAFDGDVYALDISPSATTRLLWTRDLASPIVGGIILNGDRLYTCTRAGRCAALSPDNGTILASTTLPGQVWAAPVPFTGGIVVPSMDHRLYAFDADLHQIWRTPPALGGAVAATPAVSGGTLYVGALNSEFYAVSTATPSVAWQNSAARSWFWSTPVVADGAVYCANLDGHLYAFTPEGALKWVAAIGKPARSTPVLLNGVLVVADRSGFVHGLRTSDGSEAWAPQTLAAGVDADLVVHNNLVYAITKPSGSGAHLYTIDPATGALNQIATK